MDITLERILSLLPQKEDGKFVRGAKKEFAQRIGYDSGDIVSMWLNGSSTSYRGKLHEISARYNVSVEWLEGKTDIKEKTAADASDGLSEEETQFIQELRLMSEEERKFLMAQIRGVNASRD